MKKIFTLLFILSFGLLFSNTSKISDDKIVACPTATISYPGSPFCTSTCSATVSLTGTDTYTGGTFSSTAGLAINAATGEINPCASIPGTYTVTYVIPSVSGCPTFMTTTTVTIFGTSQITPTSAFMNQTVCVNQPIINITATTTNATGASTTGLPPGVTSAWSSNTITISGVPTVPGTYNYTIYTIGGNCFPPANYSGTIIVLPYSIATIGSNQTICSGNSATITFTGTSNATVSYNINGGANQNIALNSSGFATLSTGPLTSNSVYNLTSGSSVSWCPSPTSGSAVITVIPTPIMSATPTSETICSGQSTGISLSSNITNTTFTWTAVQTGVTGASNGSGNIISQILNATTANLGQVTYTITPFANNCSGTPITVTITVYPTPIVIVNQPSPTICSGQSTNITLSSNVPGTTFEWNVVQTITTGANSGSGNTINYTLTLPGNNSGQANFGITPFVNGCPGTFQTVTVNVNPIPTVTVNSPTACSGSNATVTATPGASGTYTYTWTVPAGATNPGNVASFSTSIAGTYSVVATKNGCASASASGVVTVNPPAGAFNLQCNSISATQTYFDWSNIVGITNFNYSYSINGGPMITGSQSAPSSMYVTNNNQPVTFTLSGTGTVCVAPQTITCGTLSTDENSINNFVISPNPVTDILNIKNNQIINKVTAFNQLGQIVLEKDYNTNEVQLDFSGLKTGIYFISVDSDKKQSTFKIVKN